MEAKVSVARRSFSSDSEDTEKSGVFPQGQRRESMAAVTDMTALKKAELDSMTINGHSRGGSHNLERTFREKVQKATCRDLNVADSVVDISNKWVDVPIDGSVILSSKVSVTFFHLSLLACTVDFLWYLSLSVCVY